MSQESNRKKPPPETLFTAAANGPPREDAISHIGNENSVCVAEGPCAASEEESSNQRFSNLQLSLEDAQESTGSLLLPTQQLGGMSYSDLISSVVSAAQQVAQLTPNNLQPPNTSNLCLTSTSPAFGNSFPINLLETVCGHTPQIDPAIATILAAAAAASLQSSSISYDSSNVAAALATLTGVSLPQQMSQPHPLTISPSADAGVTSSNSAPPADGSGILPNTRNQQHDITSSEPTAASFSTVLSMDQDILELSPYQCLVRRQIEVFEQPKGRFFAETTQGRNRPIVPGQVGIRCRHCGQATAPSRSKYSILFPSTLEGSYQAAQNMANTHLLKTCKLIPEDTRTELINKRSREKGQKTCKSAYGGGRQYWANSLRVLGVVETEDRRLKFASYPYRHTPRISAGVPSQAASAASLFLSGQQKYPDGHSKT